MSGRGIFGNWKISAMFTKIDIKKFGLYKDYRWLANQPLMSRVNIIYGRNYSGKTTLSRIFDSISLGQLHKKYLDGDFELVDDSGLKINAADGVINRAEGLDCQIRVYNSDYVRRNLSWLNDEEGGEILPFALIGSDNVEAQKAIDGIDEKLGSVEEKKGLLYAEEVATQEYKAKKAKYDESTSWLENQLKSKANNDIKKSPYYVKQGSYYNVNNLKGDIDQMLESEVIEDAKADSMIIPNHVPYDFHQFTLDDKFVLTDEAKQQLMNTVDEVLKVEIKTLPERETHLNEYKEQVRDLVTKKITLTKTLQELVENDLLQKWVDKGRELNKGREKCAFCGSPITKERWEALDAHFSKESEELKQGLLGQKQTLENARIALDDYLNKMGFARENIYAANIAEYEEVMKAWSEYVATYKKEVDILLKLIEDRLANIFKPINLETESIESDEFSLIPILTRINALIEKNNGYGLQLDKAKDGAREKLRLNHVYHFCTDIHYTEALERIEYEDCEARTKSVVMLYIAGDIGELRKKRKQKELDKKDEGKAAKKVTTLLVNHFGNGSLSLEPETVIGPIVVGDADESEKPRTRFVVKRGTEYANNLSEGEKSLISFCYFIAQMDDELKGPDAEKMVIFIDDPISSLDSSHIFFMYSLIDTVIAEPKKYGQLFISTHNLEFLKFLKRLKLPGEYGKKELSHFVVEKLRKGDGDDYKCVIEDMPDYLKDYVTEYNFLFRQIYEMVRPVRGDRQALINNTYTQYYNIANDMRKFLECYLFYRYPDTASPFDHLNQLFEDHLPSEVNRVVNEYSHLAWAERGLRVIDVPEIETAARLILKALRDKDQIHFETLCKSVGVDAGITLG